MPASQIHPLTPSTRSSTCEPPGLQHTPHHPHTPPFPAPPVQTCEKVQARAPLHASEGDLPSCAVATHLPNTFHIQTVGPRAQMVHDSLWGSDHRLLLPLDQAHSTRKLPQAVVSFSNDFAAKGSSCPSLSGSLEQRDQYRTVGLQTSPYSWQYQEWKKKTRAVKGYTLDQQGRLLQPSFSPPGACGPAGTWYSPLGPGPVW